MQRTTIVSLTLALFFAALLMGSSCAQKEIRMEEGKPGSVSPEEKELNGRARGEMDAMEAEKRREAERRADAERLARAREMERARMPQGEIRAFESEPIYFDFDKSDLKPPARAILEKKAEWLRSNPHFSVLIEGHCDEQGTHEYNLALGERRASAAEKFLIGLGISTDRISTISYGEERPADPGQGEEAWAKNRRDEFKLIKK